MAIRRRKIVSEILQETRCPEKLMDSFWTIHSPLSFFQNPHREVKCSHGSRRLGMLSCIITALPAHGVLVSAGRVVLARHGGKPLSDTTMHGRATMAMVMMAARAADTGHSHDGFLRPGSSRGRVVRFACWIIA